MATFNVPMLGTEIKPVPQTSLADMLGIARGAQAYQQAEQINPLALQQQQQTARTGQIALSVEEQKDKERRNMQTVIATPSLYMTDGKYDPAKAAAVATREAPLTGLAYLKDMAGSFGAQETFKTGAAGSEAANLALAQKKAQIISNGYVGAINDPIVLKATSNPDAVDKNQLVDFVRTFGRNQAKAAGVPEDQSDKVMQPYIDIAQTNPAALRSYFIQRHIAGLEQAAQTGTYQTTTSVTPEGRTVKVTPNLGTQNVEFGMAGGLQGGATTGGPSAVGAGAEIAPGMRVPYPVRRADQPYMPEPSEAKDQLSGQAYRDRLIAGQGELPQGKRNVEEVIKQANLLNEDLYSIEKGGGFPGLIGRKIRMAVNSAEYDMLAKDLAKMALSNATAMGGAGNTVSGLDMAQVANGTIKMPPEKLVGIARRVQADQTNLDLQAKGAQIFAQSHGDNNMKAYQQAWNANADTKIFEAMNIYKAISDPQKRKDQIDALLGNDPAKRKEFFDMYENILSLSNTGLTKVKKDK
jgi:hypothetical protein